MQQNFDDEFDIPEERWTVISKHYTGGRYEISNRGRIIDLQEQTITSYKPRDEIILHVIRTDNVVYRLSYEIIDLMYRNFKRRNKI
jgi:hypothetical protein